MTQGILPGSTAISPQIIIVFIEDFEMIIWKYITINDLKDTTLV